MVALQATAGMATAGDDTGWRKRRPEGGAADRRRSSDPGDATADGQEGAGDSRHDDSGGRSGAWRKTTRSRRQRRRGEAPLGQHGRRRGLDAGDDEAKVGAARWPCRWLGDQPAAHSKQMRTRRASL
ncbi:hypothetical protein E2562_018648 [Oryza meyeriana var. granulata]|uniref:DUF834 domain-containing protein n=1 Tax=Oryza meyeriana var. granulata TaxID=110450 RepID=A0A6G1BX15_9ORYZ|nr:hypothetical protein E2562_018648 [Oryza meyeriana var. granulata]